MKAAELLDLSDERDLAERAWLAAWRDGYAAGAADAWSAGYAAAVTEVKAAEHGLVRLVRGMAETEAARWTLRGEVRTRETFGQPHPDDYTGRDGTT
jgi:hypothetical protein